MAEGNEKIIVEADEQGSYRGSKDKKNTVRVLVFSLAAEDYCIEIKQAKEVIRLPEITRVPNTPEFIAGVMNLRGEIIALVIPHYFFGLERKKKAEEARIIITDTAGYSVGILVDRVEDAIDIEEGSIQAPLSTLNETIFSFTRGQIHQGNRILTLLDIEKVLNNNEINVLRKGAE
ncbi:MAG: purine-binding chemotaxis protein CheW [Candidatus Omnitrophica bacterium]|nr:purine-binding chemotaxis protein CheW [Candidatus Omnitrophota bacterium]